jgi:preprotein translocase subunit YajC
VTLQIADNTKIKIQREHIARIRADEDEKES